MNIKDVMKKLLRKLMLHSELEIVHIVNVFTKYKTQYSFI